MTVAKARGYSSIQVDYKCMLGRVCPQLLKWALLECYWIKLGAGEKATAPAFGNLTPCYSQIGHGQLQLCFPRISDGDWGGNRSGHLCMLLFCFCTCNSLLKSKITKPNCAPWQLILCTLYCIWFEGKKRVCLGRNSLVSASMNMLINLFAIKRFLGVMPMTVYNGLSNRSYDAIHSFMNTQWQTEAKWSRLRWILMET